MRASSSRAICSCRRTSRINPGLGELGERSWQLWACFSHAPGFGSADKPEDFDYSVPGYARHLEKLLAARSVRRAHLVMHDFGGPWGLTWAANNPQAVASVTCINTGVFSGYRWHYLARIWQTPLLGELFMATTTKAGMRLLPRHGNPRGMPSEYLDHVFQTFDRGTRRAVLKLYRNTRETDDAARQLTTALRPLDLPALIVWGALIRTFQSNSPSASAKYFHTRR